MERMQDFLRYAQAFEETYADDDWSRLEEFFAEEAEYHVVGMPLFPIAARGREAVFAALKQAVDGFDRRFTVRRLGPVGEPEVSAERVFFHWGGVYEIAGAPTLKIEGSEEVIYGEDGRIVRMMDRYTEEMVTRIKGWLKEHGELLGPAPDAGDE